MGQELERWSDVLESYKVTQERRTKCQNGVLSMNIKDTINIK